MIERVITCDWCKAETRSPCDDEEGLHKRSAFKASTNFGGYGAEDVCPLCLEAEAAARSEGAEHTKALVAAAKKERCRIQASGV